MARIVFSPVGTLGDLHPSLAIGCVLAERGHAVVIATAPGYRERVQSAGLAFHPVRPDFADSGDLARVMKFAMDEKRGSEYVVRELVLPYTRAAFADLMQATEGADAIVTHMLSFAGMLVAEKRGLPRIDQILQPLTMLSAYDPPVMPSLLGSEWLRRLGPRVWQVLWQLGIHSTRGWFRELDAVRAEIGLPRSSAHPMFEGRSKLLNLALFPAALAPPQPDWPPHTVVTGLCLYDRDEQGGGNPGALREFLDAGEPPIVFTLGSSGVWDAARFYHDAAEASAALGRRAVLLVGPLARNLPGVLPPGILAVDYAPHSELLPRAAANVHHGGIGTTGQAMQAGRPMVIVPFSHDQPDNAARCERLGIARVVPRRRASASRIAAALRSVLDDPAVVKRAVEIGIRTRAEGGARLAADSIEGVLRR